MIKRIFFLSFFAIVSSLLLTSCQKDESALNDYDLFGRLQSGSGTWRVVEVQTFENNIKNPTVTTSTPETEIIHHFYIRSFETFGILIDVASVSIYNNGSLSELNDCEAEKERVVYRDGQIFGGTVFTVEVNKPTKQVWNYTFGTTTTRIEFEKCNCEIPYLGTTESGG